jgi:hypothetical protein
VNIAIAASDLESHLCRLARFGANITDAHSCCIFLPTKFLHGRRASPETEVCVELGGYHSLSDDVIRHARIHVGCGLIGWVSEHRQAIHVSPFEQDSRMLGLYRSEQCLKSFIGVPILNLNSGDPVDPAGIIACDSKKSFAFSKLQGKLLADLAGEVGTCVNFCLAQSRQRPAQASWEEFLSDGALLLNTLGRNAVEALRVRVQNAARLEQTLGTGGAIKLIDQLARLFEQSLPPHFPHCLLPNGDFVVVLDNMMCSYYQNKFLALAEHLSGAQTRVALSFARLSFSHHGCRALTLEQLVTKTGCGDPAVTQAEAAGDKGWYECSRA